MVDLNQMVHRLVQKASLQSEKLTVALISGNNGDLKNGRFVAPHVVRRTKRGR